MRIFLVMVVALAFSLVGASDAWADKKQNCKASELICISLLGDEFKNAEPDKVAHPCTPVGGDPGAWLCPGTEKLPDKDKQKALSSSSGKRFRDVMGQ